MKHFLFNLTKNTAKEARITGGGASQVGTESRILRGNPRLYTYSQATLKRLWRYVAMIFAVLTLSIANIGTAWGTSGVITAASTTDLGKGNTPRYVVEQAGVGRLMKNATGSSSWSVSDGKLQTGSNLFALQTYNAISSIVITGYGTGSNRTFSSMRVGTTTGNYAAASATGSGTMSSTAESQTITITPSSTIAANSYVEITLSGNIYIYSVELVYASSCAATANAGADKNTTVGVGVAMAATAASSGYTGAWSIKAGSPSTATSQLGTTSSNTMTFTPNTYGTYTLVWTVTDNEDGSCSATDEATVTVPAPTHSITYTNLKGAANSNPATYSEGTGIASFTKLRHVVGYDFTGWSPSSISSSATTDQTIDAQWTARAAAAGTGTLTYALAFGSGTITTSSITRNNGALYDATDVSLEHTSFADNATKTGCSGKLTTTTAKGGYVELTFKIADGYTFTPTEVRVQGIAVSNNKTIEVELTDNAATPNSKSVSGTLTAVSSPTTGGYTVTLDFDASGEITLEGTVTVKIFAYGNTDHWRMGTPFVITGTVAAAAPSCSDDTGLAYGETTVNKTYGDGSFTNTLTNSNSLSVTYSSSNTNVATVNGSTGAVTIKAAGTTTIKATWAGDASYCEDEVSYTLNVKPAVGEVSGAWDRFGGETISLSVTPSGGSSYTYQWQKYNGSGWDNVSNGTVSGATTTGATEANLQIANCGGGNSGTYRCSVTSASQTNETVGYGVKVYVLESYDEGTTVYNFTRDGNNQRGSVTIDLDASTAYKFKVHADNDYYGNNGTVDEDITNWVLCNNDNDYCNPNLTVNSGLGGTFTFTMDYSASGASSVVGEPELSITYPRKRIYLSPGVWDADGAKFAYYYFRDGGSTAWTDFLTSDDCGNYADIPQWNGVKVIAGRINGELDAPAFGDGKCWNQTNNITVGSYDYITITGWNTSDYTYNSTYSTPTYTISYNAGTGGSGSKSDETKTCGVDFTLPSSAVFTREGYLQTGWTTSDGGAQTHALGGSYTTNDDQAFYPVWTVQSYNLTWNLAGGTTTSAGTGIASGVSSNTTTSQNYGTSLTAPTVTKANYDFSAWSPAVASTMPAAATTYTATWTAQTHDVSFSLTNAAYSSGTDEGEDVATYGTNYSVTFAATSGYSFPSDITVQIGGETKTKDTHYTWDSSTGELTVTGSYITGDIVVTITALEDVYTVTYAANGGSGDVPVDDNSYDSGDEVTVAANTLTKSGYTFVGWTDETTLFLEGQKFNITDNVILTAVWKSNGTTVTLTHFGTQFKTNDPRRGFAYVGSTSGTKYIIESNSSDIKNIDNDSSAIRLPYSNKYLKVLGPGATTNIADSLFTGVTQISFKWKYAGSTTEYTTDLDIYVGSVKVATKSLTGTKNDAFATATISGIAYKNGAVKIVNTGSSSSNQKFDIDDISITYGSASGKTVTFDKGSGPSTVTGMPSKIEGVTSGLKILEPEDDPEAAGYIFNGWVTASGGSTSVTFPATIDKDTTIYAKWAAKSTPTKYNVTGTPVGLCGEETATISLAGSQSGISYQLYKGGVAEGDPKAGTGSALSWTGKGTGVYTIWTVENATYASVQMDNTGYTTVTVTAITETDITTQPTTSVPGHDGVNFTVGSGMVPVGESLEYQWYSYTSSEGAGEASIGSATDATYTTSKSAGTYYYKVKVSGTCGDPVFSNMITVTVDNKHKLTYDANGGSGAPEAEFRAAGSAALSATEPTRTNYRFLGWNTENDGTGDHYDAGASYTMGSTAVTLYAEWGETATLTWNLLDNTKLTPFGTHGTSGNTSTNGTRIAAANMTDLASEGIGLYDSGKSAVSGKTAALVSTDGKDNSKYVYVTFQVATNYEFVPTSLAVPVSRISNNSTWDAVLTDGTNELKGTYTSTADGNNNIVFTNVGNVAFMGTVTLKIWAYRSGGGGYRLVTPITISGNVNYVCPERPTITSPTAPQSIKLYTDQSKTLTVAATAYSSGTLHYQWKKDGVNIVGATSASHTVYGSIDGTAGETYVYTCDVTQTSPDACATVTSPAVSITFASTSCGYTEIASAVLTSKSAADRVNATLLVNGLADISSGSCKLNGKGAYFGLQLASGSFEVGDSIIFKIKKNNSTDIYLFATTDTTGLQTTDAIYTQSVTDGDNIIKFVVTSGSMLTALNTSKKVAVVRRTKDGVLNQNHSVYYVKVKRYGCPDIFIYDDAADNGLWSDEDNWIGPAGHGSGLPTSDDRIFINKSVTVDVATASAAEMHITNGSMVTVEKSITVGDVIIETGSTLNIAKDGDDGITVATNSLYLKGGWNSSETEYDMPRIYIDPLSTLTKEVSTVNFDISVNHYNYYPIAVPFRVKVKAVDYANSLLASYSNYGAAGQYVIKEYNGERRAEKGPDQVNNWKVVPQTDSVTGDDIYLEPGRGYIMTAVSLPDYGGGVIRFPLSFTNAWTALGEQGTIDDDYFKNVIAVEAYTGKATEGDKNANKGWNLLGVPFMSCYGTGSDMTTGEGAASIIQGKFNFEDGTWDGEDPVRYVNVPVHDFSEYIQTDITDAGSVLRPGWCFFVQIETSGNLKFLTADQAASSSLPIYAPRREQTAMPTVETGIILSDGEKSDKTTFLVSDKYSAIEYEINADLEKLFGNGYTLATYSLSGATRLAYNALSNADAANIIPIGYRAPADGEYTFSINPRYAESDAFEHINLIDYTTGIVTDLLQSSYTFSTERTQNDARFALNVVPRQETPTDLEDVQGGDVQGTKVRKMIINDQLFIIRDGQMYDATGRMVK